MFISKGNCLAAGSENGVDMFLALPAGSHADAGGEAVITGSSRGGGEEQRFTVGQLIRGSGGQVVDASWRDRVDEYWPSASQECLANLAGYLMISSTSAS